MATYNFDNYTTVIMNGTEIFQVKYGYTTVVYNKTLINFDEGGGGTVSDKYSYYKRAYGTLPAISRTGHTFNGWFTGANQTGSKILSTTVLNSVLASQTLYAAWTPNTYIVVFNADGGTAPNPISKSVIYGQQYGSLPTTSKTQYTFGGWFTAANGGGAPKGSTSTVSIADDHTLYAYWIFLLSAPEIFPTGTLQNGIRFPIKNSNTFACELLYDFNNTTPNISKGNIAASTHTGSILFDGLLAPSTQYTIYLRFKYDGSYSDVISHTFYTSSPTSYTVSFNANGGSRPSPSFKSVAYWSEYGTLATTSREGYTFKGWFTSASGGTQILSTTQMTQTVNHTLYAQWTPNTYIVSFNANGGSTPSMQLKAVVYGAAYNTLPTTSRANYTFKGWFTAPSGGTQITETTQVSQAANHTLYARWTSNTTPTWVFSGESSSPWNYNTVYLSVSNWANRVAEAKQYLDNSFAPTNYAEWFVMTVEVAADVYLDFVVRYL